jgi:hypothetical protein
MRKLGSVQRGKIGIRSLTDGEVARAVDLQRKGATVAAIGAALGVSASCACRVLQRAGVSVPSSSRGRPRTGAGRVPAAAVAAPTAVEVEAAEVERGALDEDVAERLGESFELVEAEHGPALWACIDVVWQTEDGKLHADALYVDDDAMRWGAHRIPDGQVGRAIALRGSAAVIEAAGAADGGTTP